MRQRLCLSLPTLSLIRLQHPDFLAGAFFVLVGLATLTGARHYPLGTAMRMGSGYFPLVLGGALVTLGLFISLRAWLQGVRTCKGRNALDIASPALFQRFFRSKLRQGVRRVLRPTVLISIGVLAFTVSLGSIGLVCATLLLVSISGAAHHEARWRELLPLGAGLALFGIGVFVWGLGLPLPVLPLR
ncbi:MAG: tripartite tricarboxylate transporter TctB family protein [Azoarcus sp.]|jgi:hypothetical protein|nr:tripartite tricarboxylate transporter TctB family protein [Azoarcus sp.]